MLDQEEDLISELLLSQDEETSFRITSPIEITLSEDKTTGEIELIREKRWKHPDAPNGELNVDKNQILEWTANFKSGICGKELPLNIDHDPKSSNTIGWMTDFFEKINEGISSLWASIRITEPEILGKIKRGSLRFVSPRITSHYMDSSTGKFYNVIRDAALTNYPHLKNLSPISINLSEIINPEKDQNFKKETIMDQFNFEDLDTEDEDLELKEGYGFAPGAGAKGVWGFYTDKVPKGYKTLSKEVTLKSGDKGKWAFYADADEAPGKPVRSQKKAPKSDITASEKTLLQRLTTLFEKEEVKPEELVGDLKLSESVQLELKELHNFKQKAESEETDRILCQFPKFTPATKTLFKSLLDERQKSILCGEAEKSVHAITRELLDEISKSPDINLFETRVSLNPIEKGTDTHAKVSLYLKEHDGLSYKQAMIEMDREGLL
uniref:Uncharacterized protein n=1 Tax=viral metagenome TaxID=1070528 RepID=A0A6M3JTF0_9ZZZZ